MTLASDYPDSTLVAGLNISRMSRVSGHLPHRGLAGCPKAWKLLPRVVIALGEGSRHAQFHIFGLRGGRRNRGSPHPSGIMVEVRNYYLFWTDRIVGLRPDSSGLVDQ